jgi:hypothetical protein
LLTAVAAIWLAWKKGTELSRSSTISLAVLAILVGFLDLLGGIVMNWT